MDTVHRSYLGLESQLEIGRGIFTVEHSNMYRKGFPPIEGCHDWPTEGNAEL